MFGPLSVAAGFPPSTVKNLRSRKAVSHKLELQKRRSLASYYILTIVPATSRSQLSSRAPTTDNAPAYDNLNTIGLSYG